MGNFNSVPFNDAFHSTPEPVTGHWRDVLPTVHRKIGQYIYGASNVWIGIASNADQGMCDRWYEKYQDLGLTNMVCVYRTNSDRSRKDMERDLTYTYGLKKNGGLLDNRSYGGGGPTGSPPYSVYIAWC